MKVNLMHGAGGEVMGELLQTLTKFSHNNAGGIGLESLDDGAVIPINGTNIVFTTDSHVVRPLFFPGGDIGRISVCGTVNDLTMMGGRPVALSCGMVIEEGFDVADLARIVASMDEALGEAGACLVTGDTKVVERGSLEGIVINTAGIGVAQTVVRDNGLVPGDVIIVSGTLGDHGIAIMAYREGFDLGEQIHSDVAPLWGMMEGVLAAGTIHAMKDPTRGGFASAINEMARNMVTDRTTLGRNIQPLQRDGWIKIEPTALDRRAKKLQLTKIGEQRLQAALKGWSRAQVKFESAFGPKRAAELRAMLQGVVASEFDPAAQNPTD